MEMQIPLDALGLSYDVAQKVPFAIEVGSDRFSGTAVLADRVLNFREDCLNAKSKADISKYLGSNTAELWAEEDATGIHYKTGTMTAAGTSISVPAYTLTRVAPAFNINKGWHVDFNVDFNDLAIPDQEGSIDRFALTGFTLDMRAAKRCQFGFHADAAGNVYVTLYDQFANAPATDVGFLWDGKYLYLGGQVFSASRADKMELTMGGKSFTADLYASTATAGTIALQGQTFEWRIPLADLGVQSGINVEKEFKFTTTAEGNTSFMQGKILFAAKSMIIGDGCRDFNSRDYTVITASNVVNTHWKQGDGPNTDYVIVYGDTDDDTGNNVMTAVYSKDGGKSWLASDNVLDVGFGNASGAENGISEPSFTLLDDGSLMVFCRGQVPGNFYLYQGRSTDGGKTWTGNYSKVISSNTSSVMTEWNGQRLLMWSSYNSEGRRSYRRTPMHIAYTNDQYESFERVIDMLFGTSYDGLYEQYYHFSQPGIAFTKDGNTAVVTYWDHSSYRTNLMQHRATIGFLVEEFDQMLYNTKGGYEDFETASLKYEGWLKHTGDNVDLTREESASGLWSMKLDGSAASYVTRQIPSMKSGTVGARVKVPAGNARDVFMTLKAGYNFNGLQHALATVAFSPDGTISAAYYDGTTTPLAKVTSGSWADVAVSFDIASKMGKLTVNGKVVGDIKLTTSAPLYDEMVEDRVREITAVQFMQPDGNTNNQGSFLYVDDFYCTELTSAIKRSSHAGFADVKENDWFYEAVNFAVDNGIMSGYNATKFGPNDTLNRAMVVQVLYNKEGQPALNGLKHNFSDVPANQWFNNAVTWGSNRGVVSGFGGGVFKPEDAVTIEQVAVILWNYSFTPGGAGDLSKVGNHSDWAANALRWAEGKGILNGVPFTNATEKATRAQTAQMLTNYLRNI